MGPVDTTGPTWLYVQLCQLDALAGVLTKAQLAFISGYSPVNDKKGLRPAKVGRSEVPIVAALLLAEDDNRARHRLGDAVQFLHIAGRQCRIEYRHIV